MCSVLYEVEHQSSTHLSNKTICDLEKSSGCRSNGEAGSKNKRRPRGLRDVWRVPSGSAEKCGDVFFIYFFSWLGYLRLPVARATAFVLLSDKKTWFVFTDRHSLLRRECKSGWFVCRHVLLETFTLCTHTESPLSYRVKPSGVARWWKLSTNPKETHVFLWVRGPPTGCHCDPSCM